MMVEITDRDVFGSIVPTALIRFLQVNGWTRLQKSDDAVVAFTKRDKRGKPSLAWAPLANAYSDYASVVAKLVQTIASVDERSELAVLDDLETIAIGDVIGIRAFDPLNIHDNTIPLSVGAVMIARARMLAWAGAASAVDRRPVHPRRGSFEVAQFVRDLRLAQTERGSYVVRVVAPIEEQGAHQGQLEGMPGEMPFARRATLELVKGLRALRNAADENRDRGQFYFNTFLSAVPSGVSANLCDAIAPLVVGEPDTRPLEISVTWSYAIPDTAFSGGPIRFDSTVYPYIRKAANEFRARNPETVTLSGWVHILERSERGGPGFIRLYARIDGKTRAVRMELDRTVYEIAIDAHKSGSIVSVTGTLVIEHNMYYRLEKPTGLHVIEQSGLFDSSPDDEPQM